MARKYVWPVVYSYPVRAFAKSYTCVFAALRFMRMCDATDKRSVGRVDHRSHFLTRRRKTYNDERSDPQLKNDDERFYKRRIYAGERTTNDHYTTTVDSVYNLYTLSLFLSHLAFHIYIRARFQPPAASQKR